MPRFRLLAMFLPELLLSLAIAGCGESPSFDPSVGDGNGVSAGKSPVAENGEEPESSDQDVSVKLISFEETMDLVESHRGKVVVLDCWSTYCGPCIEEFPGLVALHKKYPQQAACISLSLDYYGGKKKPEDFKPSVLEFLQQQGATFDNVLCTDADEVVRKQLDFVAPPAVFVFDQQGRQAEKFIHDGTEPPFTYADVEKRVQELLKEKAE